MSTHGADGYELVVAISGYWDQPRGGIAEFNGILHRFSCEFDEDLDDYPDIYLLRPISSEALRQECEAFEIYYGHPSAPELAQILPDPIPRFPSAKPRHDELVAQLVSDHVLTVENAFRATAEFRRRPAPPSWRSSQLWAVRWTKIEATTHTGHNR